MIKYSSYTFKCSFFHIVLVDKEPFLQFIEYYQRLIMNLQKAAVYTIRYTMNIPSYETEIIV